MAVLRSFLCLALVWTVPGFADETPDGTASVQAACLFHFVKYVKWPEENAGPTRAPWVIGVLGHDPFGNLLDQLVRGETVRGRPVRIRRFEDAAQARQAHVLFINLPDAADRAAALAAVRGQPVLTVSDADDFLTAGGVIRFVKVENKIRFDINTGAAETQQLRISSPLLRLARTATLAQKEKP